MEEDERYCGAFHRTIELIGRRWNGAIIDAMMHGAERFGEIRNAVPGLSDRLLSERLRQLECEGLAARVCIGPNAMPRYELTEKGRALRPAITAVTDWAAVWAPGPDGGG